VNALADPSVVDVETVARTQGVDVAIGLSSAEAARRLASDGANTLRATPPKRWWQRALAQLHDPLVALLLVAIAIRRMSHREKGLVSGRLPRTSRRMAEGSTCRARIASVVLY
jgi:hypothetical protein